LKACSLLCMVDKNAPPQAFARCAMHDIVRRFRRRARLVGCFISDARDDADRQASCISTLSHLLLAQHPSRCGGLRLARSGRSVCSSLVRNDELSRCMPSCWASLVHADFAWQPGDLNPKPRSLLVATWQRLNPKSCSRCVQPGSAQHVGSHVHARRHASVRCAACVAPLACSLPQPSTLNPQPSTLNPQPSTLN